MEDLLQQIIKEATGNKFAHLRNGAQNAHDKLQRQHGFHRDPSYELRTVCLTAMQMALETRRPKFVTLALNGTHRIIKDERFYAGLEPENDSVWLPAQLLRTTNSVAVHTTNAFHEETLVNVLRLFLAMACSPTCTLNGRLLIEILSRCGDCWDHGSRAVKAASLAAASQCLRTMCAFLRDEAAELLNATAAPSTGVAGIRSVAQASAVYNEVIPVLQWLCSRLVEPAAAGGLSPHRGCDGGPSAASPGTLFLTECILTVTSALPKSVQTNPHFTAFLWQKFCPTLAAALGSPGRVNMDKKFTYKDAIHLLENESRGFFTGPGLEGPQARCVYLTAIQLVRIAGAQGSLRPMLEALFHRIVLLPAQSNRTEPLRCVKEIFREPARLVDLAVILFADRHGHGTANTAATTTTTTTPSAAQSPQLGCSDDMALFRLIIDAMEECALAVAQANAAGQTAPASGEAALLSSVECVVALLGSLQTLCTGRLTADVLDDQTVLVIRQRYEHLREVDYRGPLTYQSMARLPAVYREAVAVLRDTGFETTTTSSSTGSDSEDADAAADERLSNCSGDTEGPEATRYSEDETTTDADEPQRQRRRPPGAADSAPINWPYATAATAPAEQRNAKPTADGSVRRSTDSDFDRHHAREFTRKLAGQLVPRLLRLRTCVEVDQAMQEFASAVCVENAAAYSDSDYNLTAINADGIYLATCAALLLSWQLQQAGHYEAEHHQHHHQHQHSNRQQPDRAATVKIPLTEQQFVASVQNTGVLVYLSTFWLCELYQCIIASDPLASLPRSATAPDEVAAAGRCALVELLRDAGGFGATQMLSEWQRLQSVRSMQPADEQVDARRDAAKKLARRLLTCCWESMVTILSAGLGDAATANSAKSRLVQTLSQKTLSIKKRAGGGGGGGLSGAGGAYSAAGGEALFALSLEGLHAAATLSNSLNLQHLAGKILALLASNVCQTGGPRLTASQALSMDVMLVGGLELGSYSPDCWQPVFRVCRHVTQMEHELFSLVQQNVMTSAASATTVAATAGTTTLASAAKAGSEEAASNGVRLTLTACPMDEEESCVDVYSFLQAPHQSAHATVASILKPYADRAADPTPLLTQTDTAKVLCALSHQAETFFGDAAERLSLPALCHFIRHLCRASHDQLYRSTATKTGAKVWWPRRAWQQHTKDSMPLALLLHRVGDVTLRVFRSSRPLLHVLRVWAITGPHLMDAACHRDRPISKRAIEYIQDIVTALLVEQSELPHFHFNEALLKPFENLLNSKTCDIDVKDQIVTCLYEIIETHRTEIRSGWRPLFGAIHNALHHQVNSASITDIFRVLLDCSEHGGQHPYAIVLSSAGLDLILCLLVYVQTCSGSGGTEMLAERLRFVERSTVILAFMLKLPAGAGGVGGGGSGGGGAPSTGGHDGALPYYHYAKSIDANIPGSMENFNYFGNDYLQNVNEQHQISYRSLHIEWDSIDELDKSCTVLKVWFLLLSHLTTALIVEPVVEQQELLVQCVLKLFRSLIADAGLDFGFFCVNQLLIPMLQNWLRYVNKAGDSCWPAVEKNFKHCCGIAADLVVEFIVKSQRRLSAAAPAQSKVTMAAHQVDHQRFAQIQNRTIRWDTSSSDDSSSAPLGKITQLTDGSAIAPAPVGGLAGTSPALESASKISGPATLALKQLLLVLIECSAQTQETIARVGVSCLKHVVLTTGHLFNESQWMIACSAIHRACTVTLAPLRQLSFAFHEKSTSLNGDCATVKIESCRDSTLEESQRIQSLAQQVFLMDVQRDAQANGGSSGQQRIIADDRSYFFQLHYAADPLISIPYRAIVIGLLANKMLLQLVAQLLLTNLRCVPSELHGCIVANGYTAAEHGGGGDGAPIELGARSREILLRCVRQCLTGALEFDQRPGLKFLIQKVAGIAYAANLYKQMTSAWMIYFVAMVDSFLGDSSQFLLGPADLQFVLESCSRVNTAAVKRKDKRRETFVRYLFALQDAWNLICEIYLAGGQPAGGKRNANGAEHDEQRLADCVDGGRIETNPFRRNPFDKVLLHGAAGQPLMAATAAAANAPARTFDVVEIEQQRAASTKRDAGFKRTALTQLVVASMELLRSLPSDSAENLKVLMTPTIREAVRLVQVQFNEGSGH